MTLRAFIREHRGELDECILRAMYGQRERAVGDRSQLNDDERRQWILNDEGLYRSVGGGADMKTKTYKAVPVKPLLNARGVEVEMEEGPCLWCGEWVEVGREEAGSTNPFDPAWQADGDYGCDDSPESNNDGCGDHIRPYDVALVSAIRKSDRAPVALVCAMQRNADETITPVPFAVMVGGNPFELFEDPTR